jgi:hypothetical protein
MKRISDSDEPRQLASTATDSGGGGVLESLGDELMERNLLTDNRFIASCNLHGVQRPLVNAVEGYMGDGGLGKRTLLQLLHSLFDLQKCFPGFEFGEFWKIANDLEDEAMEGGGNSSGDKVDEANTEVNTTLQIGGGGEEDINNTSNGNSSVAGGGQVEGNDSTHGNHAPAAAARHVPNDHNLVTNKSVCNTLIPSSSFVLFHCSFVHNNHERMRSQ